MDGRTDGQTDGWTERKTNRQTERLKDGLSRQTELTDRLVGQINELSGYRMDE